MKLLRRLIAVTSGLLVVTTLIAAPASALQFLGKWGTAGSGQLNLPFDLAVNPSTGGQYVADNGNNRVVQFDSNGGFVRSWGSLGAGDTQFNQPSGIALDGQGNVWVADSGNNRIKKFDSSGNLLAVFGTTGTAPGQLTNPDDVAVDGSGNFYTVEQGLNRVQKFTPSGGFVKTWPAGGDPTGIAVAGSNVYVVNYNGNTANRFDTEGNPLGSIGGTGGGAGQFSQPWHVGVDLAGNVYVADRSNSRVQKFDAALGFINTFGWGVTNGAAAFQVCTASCQAGIFGSGDGQFGSAGGVGVDCRGNVYVVDQNFGRVQKFGEPGTPELPCKPANAFSFGKLKRNKHRGTARLAVNVPGPGSLSLTGKGVKTQRVGGATVSKTVPAAGTVKLLIKAKGKAKRKLNKSGKAKVKVRVVYTPNATATGGVIGDPNTQTKSLKLVKKK